MSEQPQSSNPNGPHPSTQGEPVADPNEVIGQSPPSRVFKITVWRAMNSIVIMGFGTTKAVLAFRDNPSADAFDVALGLIWALMCVFLSFGYTHSDVEAIMIYGLTVVTIEPIGAG
jgi:hypothetical protein